MVVARIRVNPSTPKRADALTAAAMTLIDPAKSLKKKAARDEDWQEKAWKYLESIGELSYYVSWKTSALARCRLVASDIDPETGRPTGSTENALVQKIVADIGGGPTGQSQLLKRLGGFLTVPGEGYLSLVERTDDATVADPTDAIRPVTTASVPTEEWLALSRDEIEVKGQGNSAEVLLTLGDGSKHKFNRERDILSRIWNPNLRKHSEADSQVRASLPILAEIDRASAQIDTASRSRLVGNGILMLPSQLSLPRQAPMIDPAVPIDPADPLAPDQLQTSSPANDLQDMLFEVGTTAVEDPTSMAANMPIVVTADGDHLKDVQHIKFDAPVSETALKTRESAIRRLAMSLDISPERLLGLGNNSNHWSAWQINDDDVRVHIAPVLETICEALTENILRAALEAEGVDPTNFVVWYDVSVLTQDPDRKDEAKDAFDRGTLSTEAYLSYLGFDPSEGFEDNEEGWRQWAVATLRRDPDMIDVLGPFLGVISAPSDPDAGAESPAALDPVMVKNMADAVGALFRAGFDPVEASRVVGLPAIEHTGLLPVTLTDPKKIEAEGKAAEEAAPPAETPEEVVAALAAPVDADVLPAASFAILKTYVDRALELAGKRLRTRADHDRLRDVAPHLAYTKLPLPQEGRTIIDAIKGWDTIVDEVVVLSLGLDPVMARKVVESVAVTALAVGRPPVLTADIIRRAEA